MTMDHIMIKINVFKAQMMRRTWRHGRYMIIETDYEGTMEKEFKNYKLAITPLIDFSRRYNEI